MMKVFRKIRLNFLAEGKMGKYLKYAIGEILLVVIGILIALQINNWNANRILLQKERHYLNEITLNLEVDIHRIDEIFDFNLIKDSVLDDTVSPLLSFDADDEITEVIARNFDANGIYRVFEQNNTAYLNMLQAENIGLIKNDSLRQKLTSYYQQDEELKTGTALRIKELTRGFADISINLIFNKATITQIIGKENNWPSEIELNREDKARLLAYLTNIKDNLTFYNNRLKVAKEEAEVLRASIIWYLDE